MSGSLYMKGQRPACALNPLMKGAQHMALQECCAPSLGEDRGQMDGHTEDVPAFTPLPLPAISMVHIAFSSPLPQPYPRALLLVGGQ